MDGFSEEELEDLHDHLDELEAAYGIELTADEEDAVIQVALEGGPDATEQAFDQLAAEATEPEVGYGEEYEESDEPDGADVFAQDALAEITRLQNKLGRRLTQRELAALGEGMVEQAQRYDQIDGAEALVDYAEQGGTVHDLADDQQRVKWMTERWNEERAAAAPDTSDRQYNLDDDKDRVDYMAARLEGQQFEDAPADEAA